MQLRRDGPAISIVIPNFNGAECLKTCLQSLAGQVQDDGEVLVVDNASRDGSLEVARLAAPGARILRLESNVGFAAAVNRGAAEARGEWIAVLNNDTEAEADWLSACLEAIRRHPDASFLACRILDFRQRDRIYSAGDCFLRAGIGYRRGERQADSTAYGTEMPVFAACGCAALYRRTAFEAAGGYDERFFAYLEDVDLGLRLQASGAHGYYVPSARIYHMGGATSGGEFAPLAVRLRTRNAILLLMKSLPAAIVWRCLPMILACQISWLARAAAHGRLASYLGGLAGVIPLAPAMAGRRRRLRRLWKLRKDDLWRAILESESLARRDFISRDGGRSRFLSWYFRAF